MIQAIRGTKDLLPDSIEGWHFLENIFQKVSSKYGYQELRTPIFEKTEVFSRGIGDGTDIVNKEMYTFTDKGGESLTLRPEMTAALVRAVVSNSMLQQQSLLRLWYFGPFFRYERPQKGRLRQFHQYGAECIGSPYPESDVEVILLANALFKESGINDFTLLINTLGTVATRSNFRQALINYFESVKEKLSEDSRKRLTVNPLRILDSKEQNDIEYILQAPKIIDYLDDESQNHFDKVINQLEKQNIKYQIQPSLVRGLDYYCHTVFEFQSNLLGSQDSFGGGGRYDGLFEQLGGKPAPAVGYALGVERMLLILEHLSALPESGLKTSVFICVTNPEFINEAMKIAEEIRNKNVSVMIDLQRRSMKAQMREANKINSKYVLI
ncbi:MAG: histidine--tRNA ligase, partial [Bacteroidota bacterium]